MVAERIERARLLGQRGEIGDLGDGQFMHRLVEIVQGGRRDAVVAEAEVDFVEIQLQNLLLRIGQFDAHAQQDFANLAVERALVVEQEVLGDLLGDRRGALDVLGALQEHIGGAKNALGIETAVDVEILVLGGNERLLDQRRDRRRRQVETPLARVFGEQAAVAGVDPGHHRRLVILKLGVVGKVLLDISTRPPRRRPRRSRRPSRRSQKGSRENGRSAACFNQILSEFALRFDAEAAPEPQGRSAGVSICVAGAANLGRRGDAPANRPSGRSARPVYHARRGAQCEPATPGAAGLALASVLGVARSASARGAKKRSTAATSADVALARHSSDVKDFTSCRLER